MSSQARIQALFNEPACEKNQAKDASTRAKGCSKPLTPGAAAGGCAFDGAKIVLQPVTDVAHLVHGPLACEGNSWDNRGAASSGSASGSSATGSSSSGRSRVRPAGCRRRQC